jgi:hypothetical protein
MLIFSLVIYKWRYFRAAITFVWMTFLLNAPAWSSMSSHNVWQFMVCSISYFLLRRGHSNILSLILKRVGRHLKLGHRIIKIVSTYSITGLFSLRCWYFLRLFRDEDILGLQLLLFEWHFYLMHQHGALCLITMIDIFEECNI